MLENPQSGSFHSGIGVISGFACDAEFVEIDINGRFILEVGYGTSRIDTQDVCGDTDNGFGAVMNWNILGNVTHTLRAFVNGTEEFANITFTVTTLGPREFLRGLSGEFSFPDFPQPGTSVTVRWQQTLQNFVLVP